MSTQTLSRREFLRMAAMTAAGAAIVACQPQTVIVEKEKVVKETVEVEKEVEKIVEVEKEVEVTKIVEKEVEKVVEVTVMPEEVKEAPDLFALSAQGKLPPVAERVSMEPRVIAPVEEIGTYGGTWRRVAVGPGDVSAWHHRLSYDCAFRYTTMADEIEPHICKGWEVSADGSEFTFYFRKGMKWSDGEPLTVDDIMFMWETNQLDPELAPAGPSSTWKVEGEPPTLEKVDDYTMKWSFVAPYGLFISLMASTRYNWFVGFPKHYMSQFHPAYVKREDVEKAAQDAGFEDWMSYFNDRHDWRNTEMPSARIWVGVKLPPDIPSTMERNPYYFVIDTEGNQLPYIDRLRFEVVENIDILNLKAVAGAVDMQFRHLSWEYFPMYVENAEQGDYRVFKWTMAEGSQCCFHFNLNHEDPGLRELEENKKFRQALSIAIDRDEVNEVVYMGLGTPRQASVLPSVPGFKPEQAAAYAQYDPETANQWLDEIGLTARDEEGFRKRLDGEKLALNIEYAPVFGPWGDVAQMACDYWADIGIRAFPKEESRPLFDERGNLGTVMDMSIWTMDRSAHFLLDPLYQMPRRGGTPASVGALYWDWWTSDGEQGEEPPEEVKRAYELYEACKTAASQEELTKYSAELLDHNAEQIWFIGVVGLLPHVGVVKTNFRNVPEEAVSDWLCLTPGNTSVEQYFFEG